jgi:hypothetical protein
MAFSWAMVWGMVWTRGAQASDSVANLHRLSSKRFSTSDAYPTLEQESPGLIPGGAIDTRAWAYASAPSHIGGGNGVEKGVAHARVDDGKGWLVQLFACGSAVAFPLQGEG